MTRLRSIAALVLSAVFLPTLLLASLHRHEPVQESQGIACAECEGHIPHSHLSGISHTDECLVCQFLTVVCLPSAESAMAAPACEFSEFCDAPVERPVHISYLVPDTRAPPVVCC